MNRVVLAIMGVMAALVVAVGVVVIVLVATGGDDDASGSNSPSATEENGDGGGGPSEGELRLLGDDPITLDPHVAQEASSAQYIVEIFGGLLTLDPQLQILPDLAAEIPTAENGGKVVNADGTVTYTFHLRPGALFHDRKPVTADVVKFSLERAADPATQSLVAEFFLGDIVGVKEKLDGTADEISGVRVVDERTLEMTIARDEQSFLYKLTYPTAFVVDPTEVDSSNWTLHPNGTGPYELDEWDPGERLILKANDHYHLGVPSLKTVRYLLTGSGITLYERDEVDIAGVPLDSLQRVQDPNDSLNAQYRTADQMIISYIGFNTNTPPFDDVKVRQAFAMAIDKQKLASAVLKDSTPVANSIMMPGLPAYNPDAQAPGFDVAQAKQLLEDSTYGGPDGLPEVTYVESGAGATSGPVSQAILEMWRDNLGIDVQIEQAEPASFYQDINQGRYQMFGVAWIMDYPSEDDLLNIRFDSESENNDTFYNNPQVDQLLRQAVTEADPQQRISLYRQAEQIILDETPWIPLFFGKAHVLVKPYVQNYDIPPAIVPALRFITLAPQ